MLKRLVQRVHHAHSRRQRQMLRHPVLFGNGDGTRSIRRAQQAQRPSVAAHLHTRILPPFRQRRQERRSPLGMHYNRVQRIAHRRPRHLRVIHDVQRHVQVRLPVHISMAHTHAPRNRRYRRLRRNPVDERLASARYQQVYDALSRQHLSHNRPVRRLHYLHHIPRNARVRNRVLDQRGKRRVGMNGVAAAAQNDSVSRLQAQRAYVDGNIRSALVHRAYDTQGHPPLAHGHAVRHVPHVDHLAYRVRQRRDPAHIVRKPLDALRRQQQPVEKIIFKPTLPAIGDVSFVRIENLFLARLQPVRDIMQRGVLHTRADIRKPTGGFARRLPLHFKLINHPIFSILSIDVSSLIHTMTMLFLCTTSSPYVSPRMSAMCRECLPLISETSAAL